MHRQLGAGEVRLGQVVDREPEPDRLVVPETPDVPILERLLVGLGIALDLTLVVLLGALIGPHHHRIECHGLLLETGQVAA